VVVVTLLALALAEASTATDAHARPAELSSSNVAKQIPRTAMARRAEMAKDCRNTLL
jgi:hypothetical protein